MWTKLRLNYKTIKLIWPHNPNFILLMKNAKCTGIRNYLFTFFSAIEKKTWKMISVPYYFWRWNPLSHIKVHELLRMPVHLALLFFNSMVKHITYLLMPDLPIAMKSLDQLFNPCSMHELQKLSSDDHFLRSKLGRPYWLSQRMVSWLFVYRHIFSTWI